MTGPRPIEFRLGSGEADENLGGKEESKKPISRGQPAALRTPSASVSALGCLVAALEAETDLVTGFGALGAAPAGTALGRLTAADPRLGLVRSRPGRKVVKFRPRPEALCSSAMFGV